MAWVLEARTDAVPAVAVEARSLIARLQSARTVAEAEKIELSVGSVRVQLSDLVQVARSEADEDMIRLAGDFSRWNALGFGMRTGRLEIHGDTGARTAAEMAGGIVRVHGNCGVWTGAALKGGRLIVDGDTGDWLGANRPGEPRGMTGGEIFVHGRTGDHAGARMRRGLIAVDGDVGEGAGRAMIAGSILTTGRVSGKVGICMKRGTIVMNGHRASVDAIPAGGFVLADDYRPLTIDVQLKYANSAGWAGASRLSAARETARYLGDRLSLGLGEVFILSESST